MFQSVFSVHFRCVLIYSMTSSLELLVQIISLVLVNDYRSDVSPVNNSDSDTTLEDSGISAPSKFGPKPTQPLQSRSLVILPLGEEQ